jgi:hypothetical protein
VRARGSTYTTNGEPMPTLYHPPRCLLSDNVALLFHRLAVRILLGVPLNLMFSTPPTTLDRQFPDANHGNFPDRKNGASPDLRAVIILVQMVINALLLPNHWI